MTPLSLRARLPHSPTCTAMSTATFRQETHQTVRASRVARCSQARPILHRIAIERPNGTGTQRH